MDYGFFPNIICPHCKKRFPTPVDGFARTGYNARFKTCKFCGKDFIVEVYVGTTKDENTVSDGKLSSVKSSIKYWRQHRKKTIEERVKILEMVRMITKAEDEEFRRQYLKLERMARIQNPIIPDA